MTIQYHAPANEPPHHAPSNHEPPQPM
jgi:hypothetical protein